MKKIKKQKDGSYRRGNVKYFVSYSKCLGKSAIYVKRGHKCQIIDVFGYKQYEYSLRRRAQENLDRFIEQFFEII